VRPAFLSTDRVCEQARSALVGKPSIGADGWSSQAGQVHFMSILMCTGLTVRAFAGAAIVEELVPTTTALSLGEWKLDATGKYIAEKAFVLWISVFR
jgi:hypothetical protein